MVLSGVRGYSLTGRTNRQRALDGLQLLLVDEARMGTVADVNLAVVGPQMPDDVLGAEAVADGANLLQAHLRPHLDQAGVDDGVDGRGQMAALGPALGQPRHEIKVVRAVERDGVAVEEVGHDDVVAVGGELVRDELGVVEAVPDDIGDDEDALLARRVFRVREVGLDVADRLHLARRGAFVLDAGVAAGAGRVGGHGCGLVGLDGIGLGWFLGGGMVAGGYRRLQGLVRRREMEDFWIRGP